MDLQLYKAINFQAEILDNRQKYLIEIRTINVKGRRTYLQTLLLILFVAAGFVLSAEESIKTWAVFSSVITYLLCAFTICTYLSYLLLREGESIERQIKYLNEQQNEFIDALENSMIHSIESLEKFREKMNKNEKKFLKGEGKDITDLWFYAINLLFILGTLFAVIGYVMEYFKMNIHL